MLKLKLFYVKCIFWQNFIISILIFRLFQTTGYNYEIPDIPFIIEKSTPRPGLPTLYGAPPIGKHLSKY